MEEFRLVKEETKSIVLCALCGIKALGVVGHQDEPPSFHEDPGV